MSNAMPSPPLSPPLKVLAFGAALRASSLNATLAKLAGRIAAGTGAIVDVASMRDFDAASYDGDVEESAGIPAPVREFQRRVVASDALLIASPEYNGAIPGALKNLIDWASRFRPQPFDGKPIYLLSASPSLAGGSRGLWSVRVPLEHLGAHVHPDMFSIAAAHQAFAGEDLANAELVGRLADSVRAFLSTVEAIKNYPSIKRAWVELLGEPPATRADGAEPLGSPALGH